MSESAVSAGKQASLFSFVLTIGLVVAGSMYLLKTAYSRDPLWFWPTFESMPSQVMIHCHGNKILLEGSSIEAINIASMVNQQLSGKKQFDPLSLSTATHDYYKTEADVVSLELIYSEPVRVHLPTMYFTNITSLLIPLQGRYADTNIVFGLIDGHPAGGSIHINSNQAMINYLDESELCISQ